MRLFRKKLAPPPPQPTPHQQAIDEEKQKQDALREREQAAKEAAGKLVVPDDLEGFLQRSRETREARILAIQKRRTAEQTVRAIEAEARSQRNKAVEEAAHLEAEAKARSVEGASVIGLHAGVLILEAFLAYRTGLSQAEIDASLTAQEKVDMHKAIAFHDPKLIKDFLKKLRNYDPVRLEQILPDEEDRRRFQGIVASPSPYPFWNF